MTRHGCLFKSKLVNSPQTLKCMKFKATKISTDPEKKKKDRGVESGSASQVVRDNGKTTVIRKKGDLNVDTEHLKSDRSYIASQRGSGRTTEHYMGDTTGPRVGGQAQPRSVQGNLTGGTKKQIKFSKVRVKKSAASPAAKASALKLYR